MSAQIPDNLPCKDARPSEVKAYFKEYISRSVKENIEEFKMKKSFFLKDFSLSLSDSSYKVIRFRLAFDVEDGSLTEFMCYNSLVNIRRDKYTERLQDITPPSLIVIDNILISKDGECFKVRPFVCSVIE